MTAMLEAEGLPTGLPNDAQHGYDDVFSAIANGVSLGEMAERQLVRKSTASGRARLAGEVTLHLRETQPLSDQDVAVLLRDEGKRAGLRRWFESGHESLDELRRAVEDTKEGGRQEEEEERGVGREIRGVDGGRRAFGPAAGGFGRRRSEADKAGEASEAGESRWIERWRWIIADKFFPTQLPGLWWNAYELPSLDLRANIITTSTTTSTASTSNRARTSTTAPTTAAQDLWRRHADEIALIESCLCVCLKRSAQAGDNNVICLNSAMYGGMELGRYLRPANVVSLRSKVRDIEQDLNAPASRQQQLQQRQQSLANCQERAQAVQNARLFALPSAGSSLAPLPPAAHGPRPLPTRLSYNSGAAYLKAIRTALAATGLEMGPQMTSAALEQAAGHADASRIAQSRYGVSRTYVGLEVTLGDVKGKTSFWGQDSGSGPTILRRCIDWAAGRERVPGTTDIDTIAHRYGGFIDLWPVTVKRYGVHVPFLARCLGDFLARDAVLAFSRGSTALFVVDGAITNAIVLNGFDKSPLAERLGQQEGLVRLNGLLRSHKHGMQDAGRLTVVTLHHNGLRIDALALTALHPGIVKKDPHLRRPLLALLDLVALKSRLAELFVSATRGQCLTAIHILQLVEERSRAIGLEAALDDARKALVQRTNYAGAKRQTSVPLNRKADGEGQLTPATAELKKLWSDLAARLKTGGQNAINAVIAEAEAHLAHQARQVPRLDPLWEHRVYDELREMCVVPRDCGDLVAWRAWMASVKAGQDLVCTAAATFRNRRTGFNADRAGIVAGGNEVTQTRPLALHHHVFVVAASLFDDRDTTDATTTTRPPLSWPRGPQTC